jgi:hypothetical protein
VEEGCSWGRRELAIASLRLSRALVECCREVKGTVKPPSNKDGPSARARDAHLVAFILHKKGLISKGKVKKLEKKYRSLVKSRIRYVCALMDINIQRTYNTTLGIFGRSIRVGRNSALFRR